EPRAERPVGVGDDARRSRIGLLAHAPIERQRAEKWHVVLDGEPLAAPLAEDRLLVPAARADMYAHVLDDAKDRDIHLLEHFQTRSEEHTSELQSREKLVCRLLLEQ